ncbi:MAG: CCA tRNA nucleotidyltransferase [Dongiaceae bacterium]
MAGAEERIGPQGWMSAPATRRVMGAFAKAGIDARFVGGCVRDALLERTVTDIDIATPVPPERAIEILEAAGLVVHPTGIKHGTVTAISDRRPFEITTLRRDVESFGRHARVEFTDDWQQDAARRDFTMNAIFCDAQGRLYDFFGGIGDARAGRVRFVGDPVERIREDVLRLLRLFRFQAHYGRVPPDKSALDAAEKMADQLPNLSGERIRNEFLRLLAAPDPLPVLDLMRARRVLDHCLAEARAFGRLAALVRLENELPKHLTGGVDPIRRLAALLDSENEVRAVAERLRLANRDGERLVALSGMRSSPQPLSVAAQHARIHAEGANLFRDRVLLDWAAMNTEAAPDQIDGAGWNAMLETAAEWVAPALPVKGADALALGIEPGPRVGALIDEVERWWIEGDFRADRAACLARLRELAGDATG